MRRNNSSAVYLAVLSVNDTLFLLLHVLQELKYAWARRTVDYPAVCECYAFIYLVTQYLAPTLVLGFTVERFIAVCYPYQVYARPRLHWVKVGHTRLPSVGFRSCDPGSWQSACR